MIGCYVHFNDVVKIGPLKLYVLANAFVHLPCVFVGIAIQDDIYVYEDSRMRWSSQEEEKREFKGKNNPLVMQFSSWGMAWNDHFT